MENNSKTNACTTIDLMREPVSGNLPNLPPIGPSLVPSNQPMPSAWLTWGLFNPSNLRTRIPQPPAVPSSPNSANFISSCVESAVANPANAVLVILACGAACYAGVVVVTHVIKWLVKKPVDSEGSASSSKSHPSESVSGTVVTAPEKVPSEPASGGDGDAS